MSMWYLAVFVPTSEDAQATSVAHAVWPDDPNGSAQLTVSLTDAGGTAWVGGNAAITDNEIAALQGLTEIPSVKWYRYSVDDGTLALAYDGTTGGAWGWQESVEAAGLTLPAVGDE